MSVRDRTTLTAARRWFGRALVLAGTAVAGTSAALLIGQPAEAASDEPEPSLADAPVLPDAAAVADTPAVSGAPVLSGAGALTDEVAQLPATALDRVSDPASFPLDRVDPLSLVPAEPVGHLLTGGLDEEHADPPRDDVPPQSPADSTPNTAVPNTAAGPDRQADVPRPVADTPVPAPAAVAQADGPVRTPGRPVPDTPEPELPKENSALPAPAGCAKTADGQQHGTGLLGWYPAAPRAGGTRPDACADDRHELPRGVPAPQPGATPD
ncbi:hypothetical protein [Saccharopolyspora flava]|uniref:Uncharacterized protein n=1 Tax=Saccharopolyspora flava TaxID=95161 RepID=A0A1I6T8B8_9PSEU|nr:hypothetical protein [Saccharopolyspora flava]SFS85479.1 hypothetical protein SAMN05660874_03756 [Saccharopolyspora flava]